MFRKTLRRATLKEITMEKEKMAVAVTFNQRLLSMTEKKKEKKYKETCKSK